MFFSNRPTVSQAPVPGLANDPYGGGVKFSPILVTYGHAALGQPVWNAGKSAYDFPTTVSHIEQTIDGGATPAVQSRIPANRWHLARRATILEPATGKVAFDASTYGDEWLRITSNRPDPTLPMPGDVARLDASTFLQGFTAIAAIAYTTYDFTNPNWAITPSNWAYSSLQLSIRSLLYSNGAELPNHHVATVLEDVPVDLESNMGVHMLPGCVWFQVEFLMPEDPRNSAQYSNADPTGTLFPGLPRSSRSDMPRWTSVEEGKTYVFVPDTPANRDAVARDLSGTSRLWSFARIDQDQSKHLQTSDAVPQRIIRMWPYAIRITVRVWDARGRLDEPIIRTIVHRFD
jgi:hypothetical protein